MRRATLPLLALVAGAVFGPRSADAQSVSVHGFVTQGYASSSDYPIYGITTEGTGDYRTAAVQGRFMATANDHFVVQFSHQRLGNSNFMQFEDDVAVDWLFYQRRLLGNSIRVGRIPMPRGLFNEVRDVGVILPFFRASKAFYSEGVETVEGVAISRSLGLGEWIVDASAFSGNFEIRAEIVSESGLEVVNNEMEKTFGGQIMVATPIPGVRTGASYLTTSYKNSDTGFTLKTASVEGAFERTFARAEIERAETDGYRYDAYYAQAGVNVYKGLWVNGQAEFNTNTVDLGPMGELKIDAIQDYAVGINYRFRPNLVLKAEWHDFEGYQVGVPVSPFGPPVTNNYIVLGVAAAF